MLLANHDPISVRWTRAVAAGRTATAAELAAWIGTFDVDALDGHTDAVAAAVAELAEDAGRACIVAPTDPLVVQLRALGRLAVRHPAAESMTAGLLLRALAPPGSVGVPEPP